MSSSTNSDRTVHAVTSTGGEVVRYDRAGKWFIEWPPSVGLRRRRLTLREAAKLGTNPFSKVFLGRPGGLRFDAAVRRLTGGDHAG